MTPEEYDALSEEFAKDNAALVKILDDPNANLDEVNALRSKYAMQRRAVDRAWCELHGIEYYRHSDRLLQDGGA